ncbi:MAG: glycosyltransferase [Myxococcota bacterium]
MRIAVISMDTRGGLQPYLALAVALRAAGHEVRLVAPSDFRAMSEARGISFAALSGSVEEVVRRSGGATEKGALASILLARREIPPRIARWTREVLEACEGVDLMTGGIGGLVVGEAVAERLGVPFVEAHLQPVGLRVRGLEPLLLPSTPSVLHGVGHALSDLALWGPFVGPMRLARRELGLAPARPPRAARARLFALSRHVVPPVAEAGVHFTGYWTLPAAAWAPPQRLVDFLAAGTPPLCIGFGSMASEDPARLSELVLAAVRRAGVRAVLLTGWGGLADVSRDDVLVLDEAPHDWLFPRVAGVVHHGGAGTTGAALLAGVPALVVPFTMDQPFWARRVHTLGAGPAPVPRRRLTVELLAARLRALVNDVALRARAAELGAQLRAEGGTQDAVRLLEALAPRA